MKKITVREGSTLLLAIVIAGGVIGMPVYAHNGVDHGDSEHEEVTTMSLTQMEQMISLMQQLIVLLTTLKTMPVETPPALDTEMEVHHTEHVHEEVEVVEEDVEVAKKLVIEVEPHNNQTHVHVRYVDKPEDMFFVTSGLDNEEGIVSETSARTGLSADEVREALKYMQ